MYSRPAADWRARNSGDARRLPPPPIPVHVAAEALECGGHHAGVGEASNCCRRKRYCMLGYRVCSLLSTFSAFLEFVFKCILARCTHVLSPTDVDDCKYNISKSGNHSFSTGVQNVSYCKSNELLQCVIVCCTFLCFSTTYHCTSPKSRLSSTFFIRM